MPLVALATLQGGIETIAFAWALVTWPALPSPSRWQWRVLMAAVAISAGVVVLQALGLGEGEGRLREYGTLGNPDFVASALLPLLVLFAPHPDPLPPRGEREFVGAVGVVALVLTRSFATVLSVIAAGLTLRRRVFLVLALLCAIPLVSRDLRS
ncbi:MAG TPA: hypothetical protein VGE37_17210, partial [Archangium sp.]